MPRDIASLLHHEDRLIVEITEAGLDIAQEGVAAYVRWMDQLADACADYVALERLAAANQPIYVAGPARALLLRKDRRQLAPLVRDVADTLRIAHNVHAAPAGTR